MTPSPVFGHVCNFFLILKPFLLVVHIFGVFLSGSGDLTLLVVRPLKINTINFVCLPLGIMSIKEKCRVTDNSVKMGGGVNPFLVKSATYCNSRGGYRNVRNSDFFQLTWSLMMFRPFWTICKVQKEILDIWERPQMAQKGISFTKKETYILRNCFETGSCGLSHTLRSSGFYCILLLNNECIKKKIINIF